MPILLMMLDVLMEYLYLSIPVRDKVSLNDFVFNEYHSVDESSSIVHEWKGTFK